MDHRVVRKDPIGLRAVMRALTTITAIDASLMRERVYLGGDSILVLANLAASHKTRDSQG